MGTVGINTCVIDGIGFSMLFVVVDQLYDNSLSLSSEKEVWISNDEATKVCPSVLCITGQPPIRSTSHSAGVLLEIPWRAVSNLVTLNINVL